MTNIFQKNYWERERLDKRRKPTHPIVHAFAQSKIKDMQRYISFDSKTLLDVGAGNGFFSYPLDKICQVTATDYSEKMIDLNPVSKKMVMDANNLRFPDNSFDIVLESCILHHVENLDRIIDEMKRVSKKYLIIIEPNRNNPFTFLFGLIKKEERKSLKFSLSYLKKKVLGHDLKITAAFSHGMMPPNKTPLIMFPILKRIDKKIPFFGLDNIIICEKNISKSQF